MVARCLRVSFSLLFFLFLLSFTLCANAADVSFRVTLPAGSQQPLTGRVFVIITRAENPEPRMQIGSWRSRVEFLGKDVQGMAPGESITIDALTTGFPFKSVRELAPADYYVQAFFNVYTRFPRADGHVIWAHMDQWEGQKFNISPGNLYSEVGHFHLDPLSGYEIRLTLSQKIPSIQMPADTAYVKHIKIQSQLLTKFWGQPMFLGATVLLPEGYDSHPNAHYPVLYDQGHFNLNPPLGFSEPGSPETPSREGRLSGHDFFKRWTAPGFPRMIAVTFQHPTIYFDDSYAVNSANNGPYGDAIMTELIPYLEEHFRIIRQPYARVLDGGSTGGWESLALQVFHPEFFAGTWTFYPDPVDFSRYGLVDIYNDNNAFLAPGYDPPVPERPMQRTPEGQVIMTIRQMSQLEDVIGSHGRSGMQFEAWEAVYGPVGLDGYPKPLWDKSSGRIDPQVAAYMRDHGYDLRAFLEKNWATLGPQLAGKIHVYCGDMDSFYLNLAVYKLEDFLTHTTNPPYGGFFVYGRPMKGHGWTPLNQADLLSTMADHISHNAPAGADNSWKY
ncbi:MAG TPA: hypothetical protein VKW06_12885 [Candidatus Angelobacter sp.]|nr:hypothetical protein [Candidatus Angelobacter sp.]